MSSCGYGRPGILSKRRAGGDGTHGIGLVSILKAADPHEQRSEERDRRWMGHPAARNGASRRRPFLRCALSFAASVASRIVERAISLGRVVLSNRRSMGQPMNSSRCHNRRGISAFSRTTSCTGGRFWGPRNRGAVEQYHLPRCIAGINFTSNFTSAVVLGSGKYLVTRWNNWSE